MQPTPQYGNRIEETRAHRIAGHDSDSSPTASLAGGIHGGGHRLKRLADEFARAVKNLGGRHLVVPWFRIGDRPALFLLFLPLVWATGCGSGFEAASADFHVAADRHARLLDSVLTAYTDVSDARLAQLHARFLREGLFAELDSLCDSEKIILEKMIGACRRRHARELGPVLGDQLEPLQADRRRRDTIPLSAHRTVPLRAGVARIHSVTPFAGFSRFRIQHGSAQISAASVQGMSINPASRLGWLPRRASCVAGHAETKGSAATFSRGRLRVCAGRAGKALRQP